MTMLWATMSLNMIGMIFGLVMASSAERPELGLGVIMLNGFFVIYFAIRIGTKEIKGTK